MASIAQAGYKIYQDNIVKPYKDFLLNHSTLDKISILAAHIMRASLTYLALAALPNTLLGKCVVFLAVSLHYQLSVEERGCASYFSLPACLGGMSIELALPSIAALTSGVALSSLKSFACAAASVTPLALYFVGAVYLSHLYVEKMHAKCSGCRTV